MNNGQESDYHKLRTHGCPWPQAMDYVANHLLGWSTDEEIQDYISDLK